MIYNNGLTPFITNNVLKADMKF